MSNFYYNFYISVHTQMATARDHQSISGIPHVLNYRDAMLSTQF